LLHHVDTEDLQEWELMRKRKGVACCRIERDLMNKTSRLAVVRAAILSFLGQAIVQAGEDRVESLHGIVLERGQVRQKAETSIEDDVQVAGVPFD
jgi:hypothetical protein